MSKEAPDNHVNIVGYNDYNFGTVIFLNGGSQTRRDTINHYKKTLKNYELKIFSFQIIVGAPLRQFIVANKKMKKKKENRNG